MNSPITLEATLAAPDAAPKLAELPHNIGDLSTSDLQDLVASAAEDLAGVQDGATRERYLTVLAALEGRPDTSRGRERALKPQKVTPENTTTYNNHLHGRYELFVDGTLVAHLKYEMHGAELWALRVSVDPDYRRKKVHTLLIEAVLADALRRRLPVLPFCPQTRAYLAGNPEYRRLIPREHWSRFAVRTPRQARRRRAAPTMGTRGQQARAETVR
ncbi:GNAT family N-acetyltransferase [Arthrobacter zhaoxinii]|uniref:GNAT family N-acetyltransferase n=1 Tax=Arthrobacter zhaoxinii TaxID=2964616 RepID=UPI0021057478|nr:GNAT family N-acetyltransferase [Arthrobacter zhaoxinii]MCQ2001605.1 N-acetyltransferase [Arthrobacter zhaoxinii]